MLKEVLGKSIKEIDEEFLQSLIDDEKEEMQERREKVRSLMARRFDRFVASHKI